MTLVLFDFDGTITKKDSFLKFIRFEVGFIRFLFGLIVLSPILIAYFFKLIPNFKAKSIVFSFFFKGYNERKFRKTATDFSLLHIDNLVRKNVFDRIVWHKDQGHRIVIVSASIDYWLKPWCDLYGFDLLASKIEVNNGILTGKLNGKNCYGIEKVFRIKESYDLNKFDYIYAYGDSKGDMPMLEIANQSYFKVYDFTK